MEDLLDQSSFDTQHDCEYQLKMAPLGKRDDCDTIQGLTNLDFE